MDQSSTPPPQKPKRSYSRSEYVKYARTVGLNLSMFKERLYQFTRLMIETGAYMDVVYNGRVYRFYVENLGIIQKRQYKPHKDRHYKVKAGSCPACKKILIEGVCFNALCPSRKAQGDADQSDQPDGD